MGTLLAAPSSQRWSLTSWNYDFSMIDSSLGSEIWLGVLGSLQPW